MIYIDNAATSRGKPLSVAVSQAKATVFSANAGRAGHRAGLKAALEIERVRETVRKNFFDGNVIFTKNCTEALNLGIIGCEPRGRVITTVFDHNSVLRTLKRMEIEGKIKLVIVAPDENGFVEPLKKSLTPDTSMVVATARSNVNGKATDVEKLAATVKRYSSAKFFMDAAQSAGHDDYDYENVDMLASSGHKGLLGPQGTGFLLCRNGIEPKPIITGGTGTSGNRLEIPLEIPEGLEAGTLNASGIIALGKGIDYAFANRERINAKINGLCRTFTEGLKKIENVEVYPCDGGIALCNVKGRDSESIADELSAEYGICVRGGIHCAPLMHGYLGTENRGAVRFSFGNNNTVAHVFAALVALKKIARKKA